MSKARDPYVIPNNADQVHDDLQELYDFTLMMLADCTKEELLGKSYKSLKKQEK